MTHNKSFECAREERGQDAQKARASQFSRVCRAWHLTSQMKVLIPGIRRAEG